MKPKSKVQKEPVLGEVFTKYFYIVGVVHPSAPGGFFICASGGVKTATSDKDGMFPTITSVKEEAEKWFAAATEKYRTVGNDGGRLILMEFTNGRVIQLEAFTGLSHSE